MSWIERVKSGIIIETGDGKKYTPSLVFNAFEIEYNTSEFLFPQIKGSLVKRGTAKGRRFSFNLIFQGIDHLDISESFRKSTDNRRPFKVKHPLYDDLLVHPISLSYDSSKYNTTEINGSYIETIKDEAPRVSKDPVLEAKLKAELYKTQSSASFGANVIPTTSDIASMQAQNDDVYELGSASVISGDKSNNYFNFYNTASTKIAVAAADAGIAAQSILNVFTYPSLFEDTVKNRLKILKSQFLKISENLDNLNTKNEKSIFELNGGALISAMVETALNPIDGDYNSVNDVLDVISELNEYSNQFIDSLDQLQSLTGGNVNSYVPDFNASLNLSNFISYSISQLMNMALDSRQERTFKLDSDSNAIIMAHKFYGLTIDDETIEEFLNQNQIGLDEIYQLKKERVLVYYV